MSTEIQNSPDCPDKSYLTAAAFWNIFYLPWMPYTLRAQHQTAHKGTTVMGFSFVSLLNITLEEKNLLQENSSHPNTQFHSPLNAISFILISGSKSANGLLYFCIESCLYSFFSSAICSVVVFGTRPFRRFTRSFLIISDYTTAYHQCHLNFSFPSVCAQVNIFHLHFCTKCHAFRKCYFLHSIVWGT